MVMMFYDTTLNIEQAEKIEKSREIKSMRLDNMFSLYINFIIYY